MLRINRNFKLLLDDIISPINNYFHKQTLEEQNFKINHKKEILFLYRHMLKNIPPMNNTLFEQRRTYEEIKFNFREGSRETDYEIICLLRNTGYTIIEKINKGVYPPFPRYVA